MSDREAVAWAVLNAKGDGVTLVDRNGVILRVNESAAGQFAKSGNELIGACVWDFYPPARQNYFKILLRQVVQTGQPITQNSRHNDSWSRTLMQPFFNEHDQVNEVAICRWDITALVDAQEHSKRVALELIAAQEEERRRIARDLHDEIGQKMIALTLNLRSMESSLENGQKVELQEVRSTIQNLEAVIKQTRQIFYQLHPPSLNAVPLPKVLAAFCASFENSTGMKVDFSCQDGMPELSDVQSTVIYRFVQEGLANTAKHASASRAWISLDYSGGDLNISLEDDGKGFDPMITPEGVGLQGIRERFQMLSGSVEIESAKGKGTRLFGTFPFRPKDA